MSTIAPLGFSTTAELYTPPWWLARLEVALRSRLPLIDRCDAYYRGDHPLAFASTKFRGAFGSLFGAFADNWTQIVVDALDERLNVEGFRFGSDTGADTAAWDIWQRNQLDADSSVAHTEALVKGSASVLVWPGPDGRPEITVEDPSQVLVAYEPGSRRRVAALKVWRDDDGYDLATLYLPNAVYKYRSRTRNESSLILIGSSPTRWVARDVPDESWPIVNPLGEVPVVELVNRRRLLGAGISEIVNIIPIQDAANKVLTDALVASEFGAFRQRWAIGLDIPTDPTTGAAIEPFKAALDRLWLANPPHNKAGEPLGEVKFGEFGQTDLSPYVELIDLLVQHMASLSRTPPHYFHLRGDFPSGESIRAAEAGLVAKARRTMRAFGESWEAVLRLAFAVAGDAGRAGLTRVETIWRDPEVKSESELVDSLVKQQALGVPNEVLWEKAGYSPTEVERIKAIWATVRTNPGLRTPPDPDDRTEM